MDKNKREMTGIAGSADYLICGGGIVGLTIARELLLRGADNITVIEKEEYLGAHASGRNSGVLHAGIYYATDSLRAKFCLEGNFLMREYCKEKGLPILETGKVIVASTENEISALRELHDRAVANGAKVDLIDERQLAEIEPYAITCGQALFSHYTAVVDPVAVVKSISNDLVSSGKVMISTGTKFIGVEGNNLALTSKGNIRYGTFINASGAYSDRVAGAFSVGTGYKSIPFKGIYRKLAPDKTYLVKGNIYPVPDIRNPFLGVHFTKNVRGDVYIGPTAIPALGRENYGIFKGIDMEAIDISLRETVLFFVNPKFRNVALTEPRKYLFHYFFNDAKKLVKDLKPEYIIPSDKAGIRPQLVDWDKKELVMDFIVKKDANSVHILNSISPAFTCSMSFARHVVDNYL